MELKRTHMIKVNWIGTTLIRYKGLRIFIFFSNSNLLGILSVLNLINFFYNFSVLKIEEN